MSENAMNQTGGPGWDNICRECFGCTIEWPDIRRCICGTGKQRQEPFQKSRALIAAAIKEIERG